jgi:hypothetical protein
MTDGSTIDGAPGTPSFVLSFNIDTETLGVGATGLASPLQQLIGQGPSGSLQAQAWLPDLDLSTAQTTLDFSSGAFAAYVAVADASGNQLAAVFFSLAPTAGQDATAVGLTLDTPVDLAATPLFGGLLSGVRITDFAVSYASQAFAAGSITLPSGPDGATQQYQAALPSGFGLTVTVNDGGSAQTFTLPASSSDSSSPTSGSLPAVVARTATPADASTPSVTWFPVQQALGPLFVDQIGVAAGDGTLGLAIDASLTTDVVDIDLTGFTIDFSPSTVASAPPSVSLDGLAVAVDAGVLQIAGALAQTAGPDGDTEYDGALLLQIGSYAINAVGSYAVIDGTPSLFVFGIVEGPFGGPPAFFVTGLAAGFGVNRALTLPAPTQVGTYPLVEAAQGSGATNTPDALAALNTGGWVPPTIGEYWVAAGVTFLSFGLINGFALLVVEFGKDLVIALLGSAALALPTVSDGGEPYAYVEITLEAVLRPDDGTFSLSALLTQDSFLIDPSCQLTGGMAVDVWFGSNQYAGDFVVCIGGYNPLFVPPSYYPAVPRLGFNWSVSDALQITGDCYFALTPACVMGGGLLAATFAAGGLRAWYKAQADFLMFWRPFWYDFDVSEDIGVSYTGSIGFVSGTFTVELGAAVHLWGPPLRGIAHVNWWVISFDIPINGGGTPQAGAGTLADWGTFATTSLPAAGSVCTPRPAGGLQGMVSLASGGSGSGASSGSSGSPGASGSSAETIWLFSGDGIALSTETHVPASQVVIAGPTPTTLTGETVNVYPLGNVSVTSVHEVCVAAWAPADWQPGQPLPVGLDVSGWGWTVVSGSLPAALWGPRGSDTSPPLSSTVVPGVVGVTGSAQGTITGGLSVGAGVLITQEQPRGLPLSTTAAGGPGPTPSGDTRARLASTINETTVAALRASVVAAAGTAGLAAALAAGPLPMLASEVYAVLTSQPMLGAPGTTGPAGSTTTASASGPTSASTPGPVPRPASAAAPDPTSAPAPGAAAAAAEAPADATAPTGPAVRALFRLSDEPAPRGMEQTETAALADNARSASRVSALVADRWTSTVERRLLAPEGTAGPEADAVRTIPPAATVVWDLPPGGPRTLRHDATSPLWTVALDAAQQPHLISGGSPGGPLPASVARVAVTALGAGGGGTTAAGWHGGTALRQVASQLLLADGAVVRPQSPHGVPLHRTRSAPSARAGRRAERELGVVTGRRLADQTWTQAEDGSVLRGWIETWLPSWCRVVLVSAVPTASAGDSAEPAAVPRLTMRPWRADPAGDVMPPVSAVATQVDAAGRGGIEGRRLWMAALPDAVAPSVGGQLIVRAWAPAGWRLDGVYGFAAPPDGPVSWPPTAAAASAAGAAASPAGDGAVRVWWA